MSPARPSAQARSTRPAQRERGRATKSSWMRCMGLLRGKRELSVGERFSAPGVVLGIEIALRGDDHARHRLREAEERALALQYLRQHVAPAAVGPPAADG